MALDFCGLSDSTLCMFLIRSRRYGSEKPGPRGPSQVDCQADPESCPHGRVPAVRASSRDAGPLAAAPVRP